MTPDASGGTGPGIGALIVPVPEAEPVVRELRERYDPTARDGMPAHVPVADRVIIPDDHDELRALFEGTRAFPFRFGSATAADGAVGLAPDPAEPFRELIRRATGHDPKHEPRLVVAYNDRAPVLQALAMAVRQGLPIEAVATEVRLMRAHATKGWLPVASFPLDP